MKDPRVTSLAHILVHYSAEVGEGDTCVIEGPSAGEPLIAAVYEEVLRAGGHPVLALSLPGQLPSFFKHASDAQLEWVSPLARWSAEDADCRIAVGAETSTRELSAVDPDRQTKRRAATRERSNSALRMSDLARLSLRRNPRMLTASTPTKRTIEPRNHQL